MGNIPIALELYSLREDAAKDLPGVIEAVAKMGYVGVEFAGYHGYSAQELRKLLDDNGLKCCGSHIGIQNLLGDALPATAEFNKIIGNDFLIVPGLPGDYTNSKEAWLRTAGVFNEISDRLESYGVVTGYHNHHTEFHPLDGELPWDLFFGNTKKEVVMQFDTGNALVAGAEAGPFLQRYPNRARTVHLKEHSNTNDKAIIGEGEVKWAEIFELCETIGSTEWYIVEQESYAFPPLECVDKCLKALRAMGK